MDSTARSATGFKLLTILGCAGTLVFLGLEAWRENVADEWRAWQERYVERLAPEFRASFEAGIKQAFLPELGRVDRCQTCHVGADDPSMADAPQPLTAHPGGLLAAHPPDSFGCSLCHQGQGRAIRLPEAHGAVPYWEEPLLRGELVYTSCGGCHAENVLFGQEAELFVGGSQAGEILAAELERELPGAGLLERGKELVASSGCLGCHAYRGRGGTLGPELTFVGDKGVHGYDFAHLPEGVERTPLAWLENHFVDPGAVSPGTVMPSMGANPADARALAAYMLSLKSRDVPARYRPAPAAPGAPGRVLTGAELYGLFCIACHGPDLSGSEVPEIRTPSIGNEDFLAVADREYLTDIVAHGRSGTSMPAWQEGAGNLTDAQIGRIVDYVRSHAAVRARLADVAPEHGDARVGRALYRGSCATCHGLRGEGGIGTRLDSADFLGLASDELLARTIIEGRPGTGMPSWANLTSESVSDVIAYLRSWGRERVEPRDVLARLADGADARVGARLFQGRCADCHGTEARGAIGPSLAHDDFLSIVPDEYLVGAILQGRPGTAMPAWTDLGAREVGDLVAFLRSLSDAPRREPVALATQGDPGNGELLFGRTCASCHGTEAVGGLGPELRNPVFLEHASDAYLFETIARGRHGTPMLGFLRAGRLGDEVWSGASGIADFTRAQIADVVAYLRSLQYAPPAAASRRPVLGSAARGRELYHETASCSKCHGPQGQGGVGPALGNPAFLTQASEGFLLGTMVVGRDRTAMRNYAAGGIAHLSAEELMDAAAYVQTLSGELPAGRAGARSYESTDDQLAVGAELYGQYCAACHGPDGRSGYAPELNNPEFLAAASDGFLVATIARGRTGTPMRPFGPGPASLADLTPEELRAVVAHLRSWARDTSNTPAAAAAGSLPED